LVKCLEHGCDPNTPDKQNKAPIHYACLQGNLHSTLMLLTFGAKTNIRDSYGNSPLHLSLKNHHFEIGSHLLQSGSDINFKKENGCTILHECMKEGDELLFRWLMNLKEKKVSLNIKDNLTLTPLLKGVEGGSSSNLIELLLKVGVDYKTVDNYSRNFFHLTSMYDRVDVLDQLNSCELSVILKFKNLLESLDRKGFDFPFNLFSQVHHASTLQ
jgi:ankyrin repeat protein